MSFFNAQTVSLNEVIISFDAKWRSLYSGVQRANDVIRVLSKVTDRSISEEEAKQIKAEAIFLRSVFLFEAVKVWRNVPYVAIIGESERESNVVTLKNMVSGEQSSLTYDEVLSLMADSKSSDATL